MQIPQHLLTHNQTLQYVSLDFKTSPPTSCVCNYRDDKFICSASFECTCHFTRTERKFSSSYACFLIACNVFSTAFRGLKSIDETQKNITLMSCMLLEHRLACWLQRMCIK